MADFTKTFFPVVLRSLWVVLLLGVSQIRRSLVPLERLGEGTERVAKRDFITWVDVTSGDEFEKLATSFNTMVSQLGRQFHALSAMGEIDRATLASIDSKEIVDTIPARIRDVLPCDCVGVILGKDGAGLGQRPWRLGEDSRGGDRILLGGDTETRREHGEPLADRGRFPPVSCPIGQARNEGSLGPARGAHGAGVCH